MKLKYIVQNTDVGLNIKQILKNKLYISKELLLKLKQTKSIYVDKNEKNVNYIPKVDEIILVDLEKMNTNKYLNPEESNFRIKYTLWNKKIEIIYEDEYILVLNKPSNTPVHPSASNQDKTLSNMVMNYFVDTNQNIQNIHIVTRLDKDTTGLCVIAKNEYIQELFARKKDLINLEKTYITVVNGIVENNSGIIEKNIARHSTSIILRQIDENGDYAKTEYEVIDKNENENYTVLKIILHTGRTHQIRVHMASMGHILLGDEIYAIEHNVKNIRNLIDRQALHCKTLIFNHPITNKFIELEANIPDDMKKLISR